ncbi:uncharacterized membrane protein HdeD (DUF308 family) [Herpetosiphon giganteus]|nr:uncharacterized membrane protein HdeD (DUF308 family) [Herpetosiphon giganteus]
MNQKYVNILILITGIVSVLSGVTQIYQAYSNNILWPGIFGGIGFCLLGIFFLFQKKLNPKINIIICASALVCSIINYVSFLV